MRDLRLNGAKVVTSPLTQRPYRAASCELLLNVTPASKRSALDTFRKAGTLGGPYDGLRITGISDLSFLEDFPLLLYLEVMDQDRINTRYLDCLRNLRGLRLESPGAGIDFACFPELEVFMGDWHPDNHNLDQCRELRRLQVRKFNPRSQGLTDLSSIIRLEVLAITQTNIGSLIGLDALEDLRYLDVAYAPNLKSLKALASGGPAIRELSFDNAKNIESYTPIASISHLRRLKLSRCPPMQNLKWTAGLDQLDFFSFVETNVVDGDLSPLLKLPKLRYVGTMGKRHYSHKMHALNELLKGNQPVNGDS